MLKRFFLFGLFGLLTMAALLALAACGGEPPGEQHTIFVPFARYDYSYSGGKAGVGIISNNVAAWAQPGPDDARMVGADWHYNWSIDANLRGSAQAHGEFVPMVWGGREREIGALVTAGICPGRQGPILWLNEPDLRSQANMSPAAAVASLAALIEACPAAQIVGPQMGPFDSRYTWLREFWALWEAEHGEPPPVTVGIHIYNAPNPLAWVDALYGALPGYARQIWVTEFGYCGSGSREAAMKRHVSAFEADARIARYAAFANRIDPETQDFAWLACNSLIGADGDLSAIGRAFVEARPTSGAAAYP